MALFGQAVCLTYFARVAHLSRSPWRRLASLSSCQLLPCRRKLAEQRLSSTFEPAPPPGTKGTPVYADVDVTLLSEESRQRNADPGAVFVVTGASRGIGLELVRTLTRRTKGTIIACCRKPDDAFGLQELHASLDDPTRLHPVSLDLTDQSSIERLGYYIRNHAHLDRVDQLWNVAGLLGDGRTTPGPERTLARIQRDWLEQSFAIHVVGPVMLTQELAPLLSQKRKSQKQGNNAPTSDRSISIVANLSARVGSITDNGLGGWYSYRMSKAALNQATRTMALELKRSNVWCVALHPGTTDTDLSKPFQGNVQKGRLFPVDFTVDSLLKVVDCMGEVHIGGFYDWAGKAISF